MIDFIKYILLFMSIFVLMVRPAYAGEVMPKGTTLTEDSYVLTVDAAKKLMLRIEELELKELKLSEYESLTFNLENQNRLQAENIRLKDLQIEEYKKINLLTEKRIKQVERREKFAKLEKWAFLGLGILITGSSIVIADRVDDYVIESK